MWNGAYNVLANVGIDAEAYRGFAFGLGIDRLAMLKYKIADIRALYEGDLAAFCDNTRTIVYDCV